MRRHIRSRRMAAWEPCMKSYAANDGHPRLQGFVERAGHPLFLLGALALWWAMGRSEAAALVAAAIILLLMEWLERAIPAKPAWRLPMRARFALVGWYVAILVVAGLV